MTVQPKTSFSDTPEAQGLSFPRARSSTSETKVQEASEETLKRLTEENNALRAEIQALKGIIKNMNG